MNNFHHNLKYFLLTTVGLMILSSCNVMYKYEKPDVDTSGLYRDVNTSDTSGMADIPWKQVFTDTILQNFISEALINNYDLQIAKSRIDEAEAVLTGSRGSLFPSLSLNGTASYSKVPNTPSVASGFAAEQYQLYLHSSWEIDFWGKLNSARRADLANVMASDAYRRAVQTQLIADIANNYYLLLALDKQLDISQKTLENRTRDVQTMKDLKDAAVVTGAAVVQSEANLYAVKVSIPDLKQRIREVENSMSILLARHPDSIKRATLEEEEPDTLLETGVPSQLLTNRPDVMQAEYSLKYAFEMTNQARAYFFPSITITANAGLSNTDLSRLFDPVSLFGNVAGGLLQPIFNQNQNKARLRQMQARQEQALLNYKQTILAAGGEVSNALYNYKTATEKAEIRSRQLESLQNAVDYTQELLKYGSANYTDVLTSQQSLLSAELNSVNDQLQRLQAIVELYRSLGGGWK